jgi:hypothetical protein
MSKRSLYSWLIAMFLCLPSAAQTEVRPAQSDTDKVIDSIIDREEQMTAALSSYAPIVETYMQHFTSDKETGVAPTSDRYFLTKLMPGKTQRGQSMTGQPGLLARIASTLSSLYTVQYDRTGLVDMILVDEHGFGRNKYDFRFVRREFLGDVRCLVFDVQPKSQKSKESFSGRIWAEDRGYNIVRFNGVKGRSDSGRLYFHLDSWRQEMEGGQWLPIYVYSEESDLMSSVGKLNFKMQTRLWGYNLDRPQSGDQRTSLIVESDTIRDGGDDIGPDSSPVLGARAWEQQAEDNAIERLQKAGLLAPASDVDAVLKTVATNLEITNDLNFVPPLRARVLLTSPIESFTIGHTIVVSRGLIDVLPDEASLAMVIAHEVAHIALEHRFDTKYAFHDRMQFEDYEAFAKLTVRRSEAEEKAADAKALELLRNSPYQDKLANAGLFLKAVQGHASQLPSLLRPHMGNRLAQKDVVRMATLAKDAPKLERKRVDQIAALPLGARVRVDAWSATIQLVKSKPVALLGPSEKMPFEIAPMFPYLRRDTGAALAATDAPPVVTP